MTVKLSPIWVGTQFFNSAGQPLAGGKINQYLAGTTTPQATYTDSTGATPNANPIVLDSAGRYSAQIWLTAGIVYKFVLTDSGGTTILTEDNISGVNDTTSGTSTEWVPQTAPTYVSGTSFTVNGNQTTTFTPGRRVQAQINAGFIYGTITSSVFSSVTTVTMVNDSGVLDNTLSAVNLGVLNSVNTSPPIIAFQAYRGTGNQTSGSTVIFNTVANQVGGTNYNSATGVFTAPITGWYLFSSSLRYTNNTGSTQAVSIQIVVNGVGVSTSNRADMATGSVFLPSTSTVSFMVSGQTSSVACTPLSATLVLTQANDTQFCGALIL